MSFAYYVKGDILPQDEDLRHEFKGHRSISSNEISAIHHRHLGDSERRSRQCITKTLCGMLNSGFGGTTYCGVTDEGAVEGIHLTEYQKDHVKLSIQSALEDFKPVVKKHMWSVKFIPVYYRINGQVELPQTEPKSKPSGALKEMNHKCNTFNWCWCDQDAFDLINTSILPQSYVIEIIIKPWDPNHPKNRSYLKDLGSTKLSPLFCADDGECYLRQDAFNQKLTLEMVEKMTRQQLKLA